MTNNVNSVIVKGSYLAYSGPDEEVDFGFGEDDSNNFIKYLEFWTPIIETNNTDPSPSLIYGLSGF